jgi:spore maturation protein CgeB
MNFKFLKITYLYNQILADYYTKYPNIVSEPYSVQYQHIMNRNYGWSDFFQKRLNNLGNDSYEIIFNADPLQNSWALENGCTYKGIELVIEQIKKIQPEVVFFHDSIHFNGPLIQYIRSQVKSIKLTIGYCCSPFTPGYLKSMSAFDIIAVCSEDFYDTFKNAGLNCFLFPHAFEESILEKVNEDNSFQACDLIFIGSLVGGKGFHQQRNKLIKTLIDNHINLNLFGDFDRAGFTDIKLRQLAYLFVKTIQNLGLEEKFLKNPKFKKFTNITSFPSRMNIPTEIKRAYQQPLYGIDMYKAISKSRIGFNIHGEIANRSAANIRMFEVTGVGSCLVTDWKENLKNLFDIDNEIVAYKNFNECLEKIKWLMDHPVELQKIANAGQKRTLKDHTIERRAYTLNEIINNNLKA